MIASLILLLTLMWISKIEKLNYLRRFNSGCLNSAPFAFSKLWTSLHLSVILLCI